jgi:hypothetical protein
MLPKLEHKARRSRGAIKLTIRRVSVAQGSKAKYTSKQKRQAKHIEDSARKQGKPAKVAARIAYATVNKETGGGKKSGSGRGKAVKKTSSRKGGKNSHKGSSYTASGRKKAPAAKKKTTRKKATKKTATSKKKS